MRILFVGSNYGWAIENYFVKYFDELKIDSNLFAAQSLFYNYYYKNILNKIFYKFKLSRIEYKINSQFKDQVIKFNPTHILVFKGMELTPKSLLWAKQRGIKLVNYNPDNPFVFSGKGSGNSNITKSIELYDLHFTYNLDTQKKLKEQHKVKTELLPFAFDISQELFEVCQKEKEVLKVCFLGNPDKLRASFIEALAEIGIEIDVYGNDWNNYINHGSIRTYIPINIVVYILVCVYVCLCVCVHVYVSL